MPTLILLDVSLSMCRRLTGTAGGTDGTNTSTTDTDPATAEDRGRTLFRSAVDGVKLMLRYISKNCKLEYATVAIYSSMYELLSPFTREFDTLLARLDSLAEYDKTSVQVALAAAAHIIREEWGSATPCQIVLISDGGMCCDGVGVASMLETITNISGNCLSHCRMDVLLLAPQAHLKRHLVMEMYQKIITAMGASGDVLALDAQPSVKNIEVLFKSFAERTFMPFRGTLHVGSLNCSILMCPSPQVANKSSNHDTTKSALSDDIQVIGFLYVSEVSNPPVISRHLVLPALSADIDADSAASQVRETAELTPALCVLLQSSLKQSSSVALVSVGDDWFGIIHSWSDSKKRVNLFLSLFEPGKCPVPWLGDLTNVVSEPVDKMTTEFPLKSNWKRSYQQSYFTWSKQSGIHSDIQKILRHARRLPDKTSSFYKELNRLRCTALALGFYDVLSSVSNILERECTMLPGDAHPDCALQLSHAAHALQLPEHRHQHNAIQPLWTRYH